jgi:hypothetical protein
VVAAQRLRKEEEERQRQMWEKIRDFSPFGDLKRRRVAWARVVDASLSSGPFPN